MTILRDLRTDIHYGVRSLRLAPGFALAALATLVLTIGGSTAAFSIVNGVILAPLPFEESDRLVSLHTLRSDGSLSNSFSSLGRVSDLRQRSGALEELAASRVARASLDEEEPVEQIEYSLVTAGYFDLLRVRPALGRIFEAGLLSDGTTPALISHPYWQARWGGIPEVLGQTIRLEDQPVLTIVGVLPETFRRPFTAALPAPVWVPLEAVVVPQGTGRATSGPACSSSLANQCRPINSIVCVPMSRSCPPNDFAAEARGRLGGPLPPSSGGGSHEVTRTFAVVRGPTAEAGLFPSPLRTRQCALVLERPRRSV
jgi:hypothetical protein